MSETVKVKVELPKATVDMLKKQRWFKYYEGLEDFVLAATRYRIENWLLAYRH